MAKYFTMGSAHGAALATFLGIAGFAGADEDHFTASALSQPLWMDSYVAFGYVGVQRKRKS